MANNVERHSPFKRNWTRYYRSLNLQSLIYISFTVTAFAAVLLMGIFFYTRFSGQLRSAIESENRSLIEQVNNSCSSYLRSMMKISDALNYSVIKKSNLSDNSMSDSFQLLYDTNRDNIQNIALFSQSGEMLKAAPAAVLAENADVTSEEWFQIAQNRSENMHFAMPQIEHWFASDGTEYNWVIPLSRAVQIKDGNNLIPGILLINLTYTGIEDIFSDVHLGNDGYVYLIDGNGNILYHPEQQMINSGALSENNYQAASLRDGNYPEEFEGQKRTVTVQSVGYTGWKIIGVTPASGAGLSTLKSNLFVAFLILFCLIALVLLNSQIAFFVSGPIHELEDSVRQIEDGDLNTPIRQRGFYEVWSLGGAIQRMVNHIKSLMQDIVIEHEEKRKSELNALQSQINPHFLYNTLDIIVWMIENERPGDAVRVVTALARLFRISLSRGKVIITVENEVEHVRNYLMIQTMRFKNRFSYEINVADETRDLGTIKLILQPLVENAINHAMEFMDGDGKIEIQAQCENGDLIFVVSDNGSGMTEEVAHQLENGQLKSSHNNSGSGVGVKNVQERIKLYFGKEYGLKILSEPDVGTMVTIRMPAVPMDELRQKGIE